MGYTVNSDGELELTFSPSLPTREDGGEYQVRYYFNTDDYTSTIFDGEWDVTSDDLTFLAGDDETYTHVELYDVVNENETLLARLDKMLTFVNAGDVINITNITAADSGHKWDVTLTTDKTLDSDAIYVLFAKLSNGSSYRHVTITNGVAHSNFSETWHADETLRLHLMKVTGSVDENGNATLTYTPMGSGYEWTVLGGSDIAG